MINKDLKITSHKDGASWQASAVAKMFLSMSLETGFYHLIWDPLDFSICNELVKKVWENPQSDLQALKNYINRTWE